MSPELPNGRVALFLDVDGTLLDIASRPDGVVVPPSLRDDLARLDSALGGAVALVSGRTIEDLDRLFIPLRLRASGVHGAEMRRNPSGAIEIAREHLLSEPTIEVLRGIAGRYPGALLEDKRFSVAVHYRAAPEAGAELRERLEAFLASPVGAGCRILPGHMVFEIKRGGFDKGTAIAHLMAEAPFLGRRPIFLGDDITDLPGFEHVVGAGGLAYAVTTPRVGVSGLFPDPAAARSWLADLAASRPVGIDPAP